MKQPNDNLTKDDNKQISLIQYNHLNLPAHIEMFNSETHGINYVYDAAGIKLKKTIINEGSNDKVTDYSGSYVYENNILQYILTDYGKIIPNTDGTYTRHYNLTDHLGNVRVTFNDTGMVVQEDSYYPFGMTMNGLSYTNLDPEDNNLYLYNGKELQEDFDLNWYDYGARMYDAQLGRFHTQDAFTEKYYSMTPYQYVGNNPILNIDVNGDFGIPGWVAVKYPNAYKQLSGSIEALGRSTKIQNAMIRNTGQKVYTNSSYWSGENKNLTSEKFEHAFSNDGGPSINFTMKPGDKYTFQEGEGENGGYNDCNEGDLCTNFDINEQMLIDLENACVNGTDGEAQSALLVLTTTIMHEYLESYSDDNIKEVSKTDKDGFSWTQIVNGVWTAINEIYDGKSPTYTSTENDAEKIIQNKENYDQSTIPQLQK